MEQTPANAKPGFREFIALSAMMISLVALSTDAMLPALAQIGHDLLNPNANANQLIVSLFFLGLALGQMIYGPLSDQIGVFLVLALIILVWFSLRQPETLSPERRIPISLKHILSAMAEILGNRKSGGYTITAGIVGGAFLGYLNSSQQIFQQWVSEP